jgi:hypothetical protein
MKISELQQWLKLARYTFGDIEVMIEMGRIETPAEYTSVRGTSPIKLYIG